MVCDDDIIFGQHLAIHQDNINSQGYLNRKSENYDFILYVLLPRIPLPHTSIPRVVLPTVKRLSTKS